MTDDRRDKWAEDRTGIVFLGMRNRFYAICLASIVLLCGGCGQTPDIAGDWYAFTAGHSDTLWLRLTQDGKSIRGTACLQWGGDREPPFTGVPVTGMYPHVEFVVQNSRELLYEGWRFRGEFNDDEDTLDATWQSPAVTQPRPITLTRSTVSGGGCNAVR
jgi:hypothetical protein